MENYRKLSFNYHQIPSLSLPSGLFHPYQLKSPFVISGPSGVFFLQFYIISIEILVYKHYAASELGLHCLPRSEKWDARLIHRYLNWRTTFNCQNKHMLWVFIRTALPIKGNSNPQLTFSRRNRENYPQNKWSLNTHNINILCMYII